MWVFSDTRTLGSNVGEALSFYNAWPTIFGVMANLISKLRNLEVFMDTCFRLDVRFLLRRLSALEMCMRPPALIHFQRERERERERERDESLYQPTFLKSRSIITIRTTRARGLKCWPQICLTRPSKEFLVSHVQFDGDLTLSPTWLAIALPSVCLSKPGEIYVGAEPEEVRAVQSGRYAHLFKY